LKERVRREAAGAVDRSGAVGVCYYDRRQDPQNTFIDRYCSVSQNHGASWQERRVSAANWLPAHAYDVVAARVAAQE
jgi:hypothetical protein